MEQHGRVPKLLMVPVSEPLKKLSWPVAVRGTYDLFIHAYFRLSRRALRISSPSFSIRPRPWTWMSLGFAMWLKSSGLASCDIWMCDEINRPSCCFSMEVPRNLLFLPLTCLADSLSDLRGKQCKRCNERIFVLAFVPSFWGFP